MQTVAQNIADMVSGLGTVLGLVNKIGSSTVKKDSIWDKILAAGKVLALQGVIGLGLAATGKKDRTDKALAAGLATRPVPGSADTQAQLAAAKLLATQKAQLAAQKAITDQKAKQLKLDQQALSLKLAGNTTDMQNIEIQAALQRGQTEQVTNVLLLQRAIITGNADQANILAEEVLKANGLVMDVNGNISTLANAKDPFKDWPPATAAAMTQLKAIQDALAAIKDKTVTVTVNTVYTNSGGAGGSSGSGGSSGGSVTTTIPPLGNAFEGAPIVIPSSGINQGNPNALGNANEGAPISYMPVISTVNPSITQTNNPLNPNGANEGAPINVLVTLNGQTVGNAITDAQVNQSASGIANSFQRSGYGSGALPW
jgi:hypothetical protein